MAVETERRAGPPGRQRGRRAGPLRASRGARPPHRAGRGRRGTSTPASPRWPGPTHEPRHDDHATPTSRFRHELCISCGRCVRACDEVQGDLRPDRDRARLRRQRRRRARRRASGTRPASPAAPAPTPARPTRSPSTPSSIEAMAMTDERFDSNVTTTCGYCGVGCRLEAHVSGDAIVLDLPAPTGPPTRATPASRAASPTTSPAHRDRLTAPLIREGGELREASWDEAIDRIVVRARPDQDRARPRRDRRPRLLARHQRGLLRDGAADARRVGTNNIDNCSRVCHSPTSFALSKSFGLSGATGTFDDIDHAERGAPDRGQPDPGHPVVGARIKQAALRGCTLVTIDPRRIELADYGVLHLAPRPGTNAAVMLGLAHVVARDGLVDEDFIAARTDGLRRRRGAARAVRPRGGRGDHRHPRRRPRAGRPRLRRGRRGLHPLGPRGDRAQVRLRGGAADLQPGDDDRQGRAARLGPAAPARAEQRPGILRHGRPARHLHRLPPGRRRGGRDLLRGRPGASRSPARRA